MRSANGPAVTLCGSGEATLNAHAQGSENRGPDGKFTSTGRQAHGRREPFQPGHESLTLTHGAKAPAKWRPLAEGLAAEATKAAPWLGAPIYAAALAAWARAEAGVVLILDWLEDQGPLDDKGEPRPALTALHLWETRAEKARAEMGLSPLAHARLLATFRAASGVPTADDALAALAAEGHRLLEAHEGRQLEAGPAQTPPETPLAYGGRTPQWAQEAISVLGEPANRDQSVTTGRNAPPDQDVCDGRVTVDHTPHAAEEDGQ